jgi:hypothetical protein
MALPKQEKASGREISIFPPADGRVVFVCDASGRMINAFALLKGELTRWVSDIKPGGEFNLIFFGEPRVSALAAKGFLAAKPEDKRRAYKFLEDVHTGGKPDPSAALEAAFRLKPQAIYLLAGGDFTENQAVLDQIAKLNPDGNVKVHTRFFGPELWLTPSAVDTLSRIAEVGGGSFDCLKASELEQALEEQYR